MEYSKEGNADSIVTTILSPITIATEATTTIAITKGENT